MSRRTFMLPDLGEGLTEAEVVRWLVDVGDAVRIDDPIAEVETAKAVVEVPSPYAGVVAVRHGEPGNPIRVGEPLLCVDDAPSATEPTELAESTASIGSGNVLIGYGTSGDPTGGRRRRRAPATAAPVDRPATAGSTRLGPPAVVSPVVRKLARDNHIDLRAIKGSGPGGLIVRRDVQAAVAVPAGAPVDPNVVGAPDRRTGLPVREVVALTGIRRAIADKLTRSRREIPEATTWVDVDATNLLTARAGMAGAGRPAPSLISLLARFTVAGLGRYPQLNARVDTERREIVLLDGVNLGIATNTDCGLLVPVVRGAHRCTARDLDVRIRDVVDRARAGRLGADGCSGGSFTLNNYGVLGVDGSAAIINHPEVAILGIGRILPRPWVVDGQITARSIAQLSLVFDHRVCDGGTAAGFLRFVADAIESPVGVLADL